MISRAEEIATIVAILTGFLFALGIPLATAALFRRGQDVARRDELEVASTGRRRRPAMRPVSRPHAGSAVRRYVYR